MSRFDQYNAHVEGEPYSADFRIDGFDPNPGFMESGMQAHVRVSPEFTGNDEFFYDTTGYGLKTGVEGDRFANHGFSILAGTVDVTLLRLDSPLLDEEEAAADIANSVTSLIARLNDLSNNTENW